MENMRDCKGLRLRVRSSGECGEGLDHVLELKELGGCLAVCILEVDLGGLQLLSRWTAVIL